jgi:NAD(P)-dependent dehydrogenase (short-subunit alcohol dehydrogenase family)
LRDRDHDVLHKVAEEDKLPVEEEDVLRDVINTNLNGVLNTVYPAVRYFLSHNKNKVSQIAIVSSLMGSVPIIGGTYGCTKSFVINLGHVLRTTYAKNNIRVNVVLPGWVESRMADAFPGSKALIMSTSSAAATIKNGLANDRAVIDFPTIAAFTMDVVSRLPIAFLNEASRFMGGARSFVKKSVQDKLLKK